MSWLQPTPRSAEIWYHHRSTVGSWHLANSLVFLLSALRIDALRGWTVTAATAHAVAWYCCKWATPAASQTRRNAGLQTVCFILSMVAFTARAMVRCVAALPVHAPTASKVPRLPCKLTDGVFFLPAPPPPERAGTLQVSQPDGGSAATVPACWVGAGMRNHAFGWTCIADGIQGLC
jgi:hypothetical protein